jgi:hypothetical protein
MRSNKAPGGLRHFRSETPMATIRISFDGGSVPVVMGDMPADGQVPISNPVPTGFTTNQPFIVPEGLYCFGLRTSQRYTPLWQLLQAIDGEQADIAFHKLP